MKGALRSSQISAPLSWYVRCASAVGAVVHAWCATSIYWWQLTAIYYRNKLEETPMVCLRQYSVQEQAFNQVGYIHAWLIRCLLCVCVPASGAAGSFRFYHDVWYLLNFVCKSGGSHVTTCLMT